MTLQWYLAHKKQRPPRTPQQEYATYDPMAALRWGAVSYERGTPVEPSMLRASTALKVYSMQGQFFGFQNATFRVVVQISVPTGVRRPSKNAHLPRVPLRP